MNATVIHRLQMLWLHLESDISFYRKLALNTFTWKQPFFGSARKSDLGFPSPGFQGCLAALSLIVWFMVDVSSYAASVRARDVLPPLSIKVQVVTTVWHSLSACGFAGLAL